MELRSVFIDASHIDSGFQGTHTFLINLYREVQKQQPELKLYFGSGNPTLLEERLRDIPEKTIVPYKYASRLKQGLFDAPRLIKQIKPDLAHYQYVVPPGKKQCPYLLTIHDVLIFTHPHLFSWRFRAPRKKLYAQSYKKADIITTVSEFSKKGIEDNLGHSKKIWLTPNAVDKRAVSTADKQAARIRVAEKFGLKKRFVLSVGRYEKRKNFELLSAAFQELQLTYVDLVFAGNGVDQAAPDWVKKINRVSTEDLRDLYLAAELFVFPSEAEGFGIPPLEAANALCPVITSDSTALREFDFLQGKRFAVNNQEALQKAMSENLRPFTFEELLKVQEQMHQQFSWEKSAQTMLAAIADFSA